MNHRTVIKAAIVVVILVTVVWSIVNVSEYAHGFHSGLVVWTLGASVGTANALSVYAFVIARSRNVRVAAVAGVILFGAMSGALQTLLYVGNGAPLVAALAFGWFGPVAEGVLSWLHAVLSEEQTTQHKAKAPVKQVSKPMQVAEVMQPMQLHVSDKERAMQLHSEGYSPAEVAKMLNRKYPTVSSWIRRGAQVNGATLSGSN